MAKCKRDVTPLLTHQSYVSFALSHRFDLPITASQQFNANESSLLTYKPICVFFLYFLLYFSWSTNLACCQSRSMGINGACVKHIGEYDYIKLCIFGLALNHGISNTNGFHMLWFAAKPCCKWGHFADNIFKYIFLRGDMPLQWRPFIARFIIANIL